MSDAWQIHEVDWPVDPPAAAERFADGGELAWLDSATDAAADVHGRFSMICASAGVARTIRRPAGDVFDRRRSPSRGRQRLATVAPHAEQPPAVPADCMGSLAGLGGVRRV